MIGPESTGKSALCSALAAHYNTLWVPEYAREYLEINGADYVYDDLIKIAKGQIKQEEAIADKLLVGFQQSIAHQSKKLFIDTDMYVMKVWSEFVFNQCDNWILNRIASRQYDLYLLCDIDLPWVQDELREYPDRKIRERLFNFYKDILINQSVPWQIISGLNDGRLQNAINFIESPLHKKLL